MITLADIAALARFPAECWRVVPRADGDANIYCGNTVVALCVRKDLAHLIIAAVQSLAREAP